MDAVWNLNTIVDRKRWGVGGLSEANERKSPWHDVVKTERHIARQLSRA